MSIAKVWCKRLLMWLGKKKEANGPQGTDELFLVVMSIQYISIVHHVIALSSKVEWFGRLCISMKSNVLCILWSNYRRCSEIKIKKSCYFFGTRSLYVAKMLHPWPICCWEPRVSGWEGWNTVSPLPITVTLDICECLWAHACRRGQIMLFSAWTAVLKDVVSWLVGGN